MWGPRFAPGLGDLPPSVSVSEPSNDYCDGPRQAPAVCGPAAVASAPRVAACPRVGAAPARAGIISTSLGRSAEPGTQTLPMRLLPALQRVITVASSDFAPDLILGPGEVAARTGVAWVKRSSEPDHC
jgi:hypothetical protein